MFQVGLESFFADKDYNNSKTKVAVVSNFTGRDRNGKHLVYRIAEDSRFVLKRIFSPEHGFGSNEPDGEAVANSKIKDLNIEIISLYGANRKPDLNMLKDLDLLIFDIQDVGVRFYTYISTLRNIMEAANEANLLVAVLDRPNFLGRTIEGPDLENGFESFVGHLPIPLRYGLTSGELALWIKEHYKLNNELKVYKCSDYNPSMTFKKLDFPWFKPSPSMPDIKTAMLYPGTCFFEGTELSEGRGTDAPFRKIGAPWIDSNLWLEALKPLLPDYVSAKTTIFTPTFSKFDNQECNGVFLELLTDEPKPVVEIGIALLYSLMQTHKGKIDFTGRPSLSKPFIDYLAGTDKLRKGLLEGKKTKEIISSFPSLRFQAKYLYN